MDKDKVNNIIMKSEDDYERLKDKVIMYDEDIKALRILLDIKTKRIQDLMNRLEKRTNRIDKAIEILENIYMLDNVTITNNACNEIDKAINILKGEDKEW